ncbi:MULTISPECIES: ABC transporter permease [Paenibacillus]|jgi:putative aldouronate transport system permease protein|uniref:ABC transporter permease subunit n=1 Tax=Paenibacillus polymyxa TaxID=1406 RepID=A0AAE9IFW3_PAEPO|nr:MULTISPECIES: ABC transporter permease subunit [Paenibacillus]MCF2720416.1 ABC transporter permease subunit [Paenibacillus sp. UKAQ_18]MCP3793973.1 ABC transporter permease subunit [Paenibacillus sp. CH40]MCP3809928.1 ABC transporter permease subunit [Paenibacillus sp. Lou8.1]MDY7990978.1 ABC transporter permease subunit [Paenibacillus polymyxa]MDY8047450.1 ABC transporter permease subunit [Paenibacillus polymyxa]
MVNSRTSELDHSTIKPNRKIWNQVKRDYELYLFLLPIIIIYLVFKYYPMYGIQIAFKDFSPSRGIWGSEWVGFKHFIDFFDSYNFWTIMTNTLTLSVLSLVFSFPAPIIIAIMLNQMLAKRYKKIVQTVIYAPHFISTVVLVGMLNVFLSPNSGIVNHIITLFGGDPIMFLADEGWFRPLYILSGVWQETGFATIIYLAALAGVNPELHEAAIMDGASKWKRVMHVDIPSILPTIVILLILALGNIMGIGFEKAFLMQNDLNYATSNIIPTYVYEIGIQKAQYSFSTAIGLFNSVVNIILIITVNRIAKKLTETSLW